MESHVLFVGLSLGRHCKDRHCKDKCKVISLNEQSMLSFFIFAILLFSELSDTAETALKRKCRASGMLETESKPSTDSNNLILKTSIFIS